jgi:hypothetical protein
MSREGIVNYDMTIMETLGSEVVSFDVIRFGLALDVVPQFDPVDPADDSANLDEGSLSALMHRIAGRKFIQFLKLSDLDTIDLLGFYKDKKKLDYVTLQAYADDGRWRFTINLFGAWISYMAPRRSLFPNFPTLLHPVDIISIKAAEAGYTPGAIQKKKDDAVSLPGWINQVGKVIGH